MNKRRWIGILGVGMSFIGSALQAATLTTPVSHIINAEGTYINTRNYQLTYKKIIGFLVSPLQIQGELLAPFGQNREGYTHQGIDIRAELGTPIFAVADGIITKAAPDSKGIDAGGGHMIFLDLGNGVEVRYMHLSAYGVQEGEYVKAGQVIGFTGNSGDSTTPHLHFEYRIKDEPIDPAFIFEASDMLLIESSNMKVNVGIYNNYQKNGFYVIQE